MKGDKERFIGAGMDDYLSKPIKMGDIKFIIDKWLGNEDNHKDIAGTFKSVIVDYDDLMDRLGGDRGIADELLMLFSDRGEQMIAELNQALISRDEEASRRAAHTLKGTVANVGARKMGLVLESIHSKIKEGEFPDTEELTDAFKEFQNYVKKAA